MAVIGSPSIKPATRRIMQRADQIFVSAASIWEISIKARLGKIEADPDALVDAIGTSGFVELPVRSVHAAGVAQLPLHHSDPFDRLLIAQAIAEPLNPLTVDAAFSQYRDVVLPA